YKQSDNFSIDFGYEIISQQINYELKYSVDDIEEIGEDIFNNSYLHSTFLQGRLEKFYKFDLTLGLRNSYYNQTDKLYLEPRFNLTYHWNNYFRLKAAIGKYNQFLTKVFTGEQTTNSKSLWFISDGIDIPVGESNQYILGFQYSKNKFLVDVEYYKKKVDGIVKYVYDFSSYYEFNTSYYETGALFHSGSSDIQGIDVLISKDFGKFYSWISYSLSENNNKFNILNNGKQFPSVNDQRHEFKIAGIKSFKNFDIALTWIYGTGFVYCDPYNANYDISNTFEEVKLPDYHKLDCSLTYRFKLKNINGNIGLSVLNIYNRKNNKIQELLPFVDEYDTYYDLMS
ncbi:MAG: TonB-dependent receptor, partial [Bacteroidales bacterium]|nr:TonB-dependent receptor [Bacteroidales bacterium]